MSITWGLSALCNPCAILGLTSNAAVLTPGVPRLNSGRLGEGSPKYSHQCDGLFWENVNGLCTM